MAQQSGKPLPVRPIISAGIPQNISAVDKARLESGWNAKALARQDAITKETAVPTAPSLTLRFELKKFGRFWNAYALDGKRMAALLPTPSLMSSAIDACYDAMCEQAGKA